MDPRTTTLRRRTAATVIALVAFSATGLTAGRADPAVPIGPQCPALYALGVQGAEESAPETSISNDSGSLGQVFGHLAAAAGDLVQRAYVPYGRSDDGTELPYEQAIATATDRLEQMAADVVQRCPHTKIAVAGYAHGAPAASAFAEKVGAGDAPVAADTIAGIALLANPARAVDSPVLPGRPGTTTPAPAPGSTGTNVSAVALTNPPLSGAGISGGHTPEYGALTGRVADLCVPGDATCDTPPGAPLATTVANIAARTDLRDPIAAITTLASALSATIYTTTVDVVNDDLNGTSLDQLSYQPTKTLGQRLTEASDPASTPPEPHEALAALFKIGTIGLSAVVSVARQIFTPATVAELATVGLVNPWAAVATLGTKLAGAVMELVPPQTASRWINDTFDAVTSTVTDPGDLYSLAGTARYSSALGRDGSYGTASVTTDGRSALAATAGWFSALAHDLADAPDFAPGAPRPTTASSTVTTSPSSSPTPQPPLDNGGL